MLVLMFFGQEGMNRKNYAAGFILNADSHYSVQAALKMLNWLTIDFVKMAPEE